MNIEEFKSYVKEHMCDGEIMLSENDIKEIETITKTYLTPEFIYGNNPRCNIKKSERIDGVGEFEVSIELDRNRIKALNIAGDYFLLGSLDRSEERRVGKE